MDTAFKVGGQSLIFPTTADMVDYNGKKLDEVLDELKDFVLKDFEDFEMSDFGRQLFEANEDEFFRLLQLTREDFWDENQNRFVSIGRAFITDARAKVGSKSLKLESASLKTPYPIEFGGDPFAIRFYLYMSTYRAEHIFRAIGTSYSFGLSRGEALSVPGDDAKASLWYSSGTSSTAALSSSTPRWKYGGENTWVLIELEYDGSGSFKIYQNGILKKTVSKTIPREPRRLVFGSFLGYFDEFKLIDNGVTKVLLHFE